MKFKWLVWTGLLAVLVFFLVVFFGMKYNWVSGANPKFKSGKAVQSTDSTGTVGNPNLTLEKSIQDGAKPELIDEKPIKLEGQTLGTSTLTIEEIVSQCHDIATSVGIPELHFEQSVTECIDRNSSHLKNEKAALDERSIRIREQCDLAITRSEFLSTEEVKLLVDECVASMQSQ